MIDIHAMSPAERLELIELLWDSLSSSPDAIPFTDEQRAELNRRLDELEGFTFSPEEEAEILQAIEEADRGETIPAEQVLEKLTRR